MDFIRDKLKRYPEITGLILFVLGAIVVTYFTNHYFAVFAPIIIAYVVARLLHPLMVKIRSVVKIPNILNTILCMVVFVVLASAIVYTAVDYLLDGATYLINLLSSAETIDSLVAMAQDIGIQLDSVLKFLDIQISMEDLSGVISDVAKSIITFLSNIGINMAMKVPTLLMALIIGIVSAFYMLADYDRISKMVRQRTSPKTMRFLDVFNTQALSSFVKMILSYVVVSAICFVELLVGFLVLGIKDSSFIALLIAILDVLPVLGSGAVLIPWGILALLMGQPMRGFGILILYAVITVVRQIVEPKIVGSQIGLHPLVTIASLYVGLQLMGGMGLIMAPLYVIVCKKLHEDGIIKFFRDPVNDDPDKEVITKN